MEILLELNKLLLTSAWQNAGLSAKLNFSPFYPPKAVCFCFFIKFTKRLTALATSRSELNFRSIQARTSPSRGPLAESLNQLHVKKNRTIENLLIIIISLLLINCKSQTIEENDYIINKAKNEKAVIILFPCFPCDKTNTKTEAKFLDKIENEGITTILLDYNQKLYLDEFEKEDLAKRLNS